MQILSAIFTVCRKSSIHYVLGSRLASSCIKSLSRLPYIGSVNTQVLCKVWVRMIYAKA